MLSLRATSCKRPKGERDMPEYRLEVGLRTSVLIFDVVIEQIKSW